MKEGGGAGVRLDAISNRPDAGQVRQVGARVWLTRSPDRLAVLPGGPAGATP